MFSLRSKITMLTVWITVFAVVAVALMSVLFIRNTESQKSQQLLLLLCETGERNLDYYFRSVEKSVRKVAAYTEKELDSLDDAELEEHSKRIRKYFDEVASKTNGVLTYYWRIDPTVSKKEKGFWYTNLTGNEFTEHEVTDISRYDMEDTTKLVWFTVPRKTGNPIWQPPYETENLDVKVISYNVPIYHRGKFVGVIGIEIDYSMVKDQVESIRLYNEGYAFLTDAQGTLIVHPQMEKLAELSEEERLTVPEGVMSESTFTTYTYNGVLKEAAWLGLTNGMRLYVSVPVHEADGDWERLVEGVLILAAGVILLTIVLTRFFAVRLTRPLKQLTEAAKLADQGNYDFTLDYNGRDEVGTLTNTFKRMAAHVKEHIRDLNKKVFVDALTSVRNKGAYTNYIEEMQQKIEKGEMDTEFAIGVFDCDDLKSVNDLYGHDKGDIYLQTASRLICKVFQHSPVFRIGGDEFSVILRNEDYRNRKELIDEFEKAMAAICASTENRWEQVHVAIGVAAFSPDTDNTVIDTVRRADNLMYTNKRRHKENTANQQG